MTLENLPNIVRFRGELEDFASASAPLFFSFFLLFLPSIAINLAWHRPSVADIRKSLLTCRLCVCVSLCHRNAAGGGGKKHWLSFLSSLVGGKKKKNNQHRVICIWTGEVLWSNSLWGRTLIPSSGSQSLHRLQPWICPNFKAGQLMLYSRNYCIVKIKNEYSLTESSAL